MCERTYLRERLAEIQQLFVTTAHPLLLNLLDRHDKGFLNRDELDECLRDLGSFVIRRTICGESTRAYGRWFPEAIPAIITRPSVNLRQYWMEKGWPDDATFIARLAEFPIYARETKKCRLLLERLERAEGNPETANPRNLNIEHVLPQTVENDEAGRAWQGELGVTWKQEHEKLVHTLGNLTLTGINPELGNNSFAAKKVMFGRSNVSLNTYFAGIARWSGAEIRKRGIELGKKIARLWPRPDGEPYIPRTSDPADPFEDPFEEPEAPRQQQPYTHGNLKIEVHWSALGFNESDETIYEPQAGLTHAKFIRRLIEQFGREMRDKLQRIAVARSHPLSANPEQDFFNQSAGKAYSYKPVSGSLFLFTNTSTKEKKDDILALCHRLDFPSGSVEVA